MKKEKTVRTYQRRTKSGKMVTVREHKASYDAAEEARKAAAKKAGAGSELSKKKAAVEENPLGFSADDYKEWYHWDMEDDANNEAALRVEKALIKKMGKKAYNKYLEDMSNSYSARGHKKAHQALLDEYTAQQKKQDVESAKTAKDIARSAKEKAAEAKASKGKTKENKSIKAPKNESQEQREARWNRGEFTDDEKSIAIMVYDLSGSKNNLHPKLSAWAKKEIKRMDDERASKVDTKILKGLDRDVVSKLVTLQGKKKLSKEDEAFIDKHVAPSGLIRGTKVSAFDAIAAYKKDSKGSSKSSTTPTKKAKDSDLVEHYDQFNKKHMGKAVGDSFTFSEGRGKDKITYDARFVTDGRGRYGYVVRDKAEGPSAKYFVGISDGYELPGSLPTGLRKAAEAQGLTFKGGEFVRSSDKPSSAKKPTSTKSSTTSTTGAGADWSKATVDKIGREYGGGYTIVGTPNDSLWSSTNFRTKSQALDFIKRKQKESSAKSEKEEPKSRRSSTPKTSESYATLKKFEGSPYRMRISKNGDPMPGEKQKLAKWKAGHRKLKEYLSTPEGAADKKSYVAKQKEKERKAEERRKRDVAKWREKYTAEKKAKKEKFDAKVSELKGKGFKAKKRVTTKYTSYIKGVNTVLDCFVSPDKKSAYVYRSGEESPTLRKATAKELKIIIGEAKAKKPTKMR